MSYTRIDPQNGVLPTTPSELREAGNQSVAKENFKQACHMYTLAIDMVTRDIQRDECGFAAPGDLYECNMKSNGELSKLLANRSLAHLKLNDFSAALEDAEASVQADPTYEKGHLRVLAAMEAFSDKENSSTLDENTTDDVTTKTKSTPSVVYSNADMLKVVTRGLEACPDAKYLSMKLGRLQCLVKAEAKTEEKGKSSSRSSVEGSSDKIGQHVEKNAEPSANISSANSSVSILDATMKAAHDVNDSRHVIACADLGASYACGAYGLEKDTKLAEKYLNIGAEGGDMTAQRNLGLLLLELKKPEQAAKYFKLAAQQGDEVSKAKLLQLSEESEQVAKDALEKLKFLASSGNQRAIEMIKEFEQNK